MRKHWLYLAILACAALPAQAVEVQGLYAATVSVPDESDDARGDALRSALERVMIRVSGDPRAPDLSGAGAVLDRARSLVQQYGYRGSEASGLELRAVFDGGSVERAMRDAGLPVWGRERPRALVWLALGDKLVTRDGPEAVATALRDAAEARGIPIRLPRGDEAASGRVTPSDIRAGNDARLAAVARGYDAGYLLVGDAQGGAGDWRADWRLLQDGNEISAWSAGARDSGKLMADAVRRSADAYAHRFAVSGSGSADAVTVAVDGISGASGYTRVSRFLSGLTAVDAVSPALVNGESVVFRVDTSGGADMLERSIGLADWLAGDDQARHLAGLYAGGGRVLGYRITR